MVSISIKIRINNKEDEKIYIKGTNKKKEKKLKHINKITNKKAWSDFGKKCNKNKQIKEMIEEFKKNNIDKTLDNRTIVEERWNEFKRTTEILEDWIRDIDKELGEKQYAYLNQTIKLNDNIINALIMKKKAWKKYTNSMNTNEEQREWKNFKWMRNRAKKLLKKKLDDHRKAAIKEIEDLKTENPRTYWKLLKGLNGKKKKTQVWDSALNEVGEEVFGDEIKLVWKEAYKKLGGLNLDREDFDNNFAKEIEEEIKEMTRKSHDYNDELGKQISLDEVEKIVKRLKNGKASGVDGVVNEILKFGGNNMYILLCELCKIIFEKEMVPDDWLEGIIFPIYKDDDRRHPLNYRGITLLSVVSKVYTSIINERLSEWCETNNVIAEEQGGFRKGRGCVDQLFVLTGIINKRKNLQTYCCFIDLKKAFDRVWRNGLWKALWEEGIRGKMWRVIRSLYRHTKSKILLGQDETDFFDIEAGVRQGCVLSPILFSIFINKMAKEINNSKIGVTVNNKKIAVLLYADDIVIITEDPKDLKSGLKIATEFGKKWRCKYNTDKTQVVIFGKKTKKKHTWVIANKEIDQVDSYKYLGIELENKLRWKLFKTRLLDKAERNMRKAMGMGSKTKHLSAKAAIGLWKALVRPVLEYGAEIWGESSWKESEILQRTMAKRILGMSEKATNEAVLGDLGWWPLKARRDMIRLRYWQTLLNMREGRLPRLIYEGQKEQADHEHSWTAYTKKLLMELDLQDFWQSQKITLNKNGWNNLIEEKIQEREQREWRRRALSKPKLRTYIKYKEILKEEEYLKNEDTIGRRMLARLRSGTNNLRIETGRYERPRIPEKYRTCLICMEDTENEEHFLHHCIAYKDIREDFIEEIENKNKAQDITKILFGAGKLIDINKAIRYIRRAMARRNRILKMA